MAKGKAMYETWGGYSFDLLFDLGYIVSQVCFHISGVMIGLGYLVLSAVMFNHSLFQGGTVFPLNYLNCLIWMDIPHPTYCIVLLVTL